MGVPGENNIRSGVRELVQHPLVGGVGYGNAYVGRFASGGGAAGPPSEFLEFQVGVVHPREVQSDPVHGLGNGPVGQIGPTGCAEAGMHLLPRQRVFGQVA